MLAERLWAAAPRRAAPLGRRHADLPRTGADAQARTTIVATPLRVRRRRGGRDRGRPARHDARSSSSCCGGSASTACRWACRTSHPRCRRRFTAVSPSRDARAVRARPERLRVDQRRPDLRPAAPDARDLPAARSTRSSACGPTASRSIPTRTCRGSGRTRSSIDAADAAGRRPQARAVRRGRRDLPGGAATQAIGMDHFALPGDELAQRRRASGPAPPQLHGLHDAARARHGRASASPRSATCAGAFAQNMKKLPAYYARHRRRAASRSSAATR